jgi:hypothetical protein
MAMAVLAIVTPSSAPAGIKEPEPPIAPHLIEFEAVFSEIVNHKNKAHNTYNHRK